MYANIIYYETLNRQVETVRLAPALPKRHPDIPLYIVKFNRPGFQLQPSRLLVYKVGQTGINLTNANSLVNFTY